jgi:hypothetical protein
MDLPQVPGLGVRDLSDKRDRNPSSVPHDVICLSCACTAQLACVQAGLPQGRVSPDKALGNPLHQGSTVGWARNVGLEMWNVEDRVNAGGQVFAG